MRLNRITSPFVGVALLALVAGGCATVPATTEQRDALQDQSKAALEAMSAQDPSVRAAVERSYGYVVFPSVAKGGVVAGGAYGRGIVYEQGRPVGWAELNQGSIGAQIGGYSFSEIIAFNDENGLRKFQAGNFDLGANAAAIALKAGATASAQVEGGTTVFVVPQGGLMLELSLSGQQFNYQPMDEADRQQLQ